MWADFLAGSGPVGLVLVSEVQGLSQILAQFWSKQNEPHVGLKIVLRANTHCAHTGKCGAHRANSARGVQHHFALISHRQKQQDRAFWTEIRQNCAF